MIRLYGVSKAYRPDRFALKELTLRVRKGDFVFLTGVSGAGKSTLLRLMFGAEQVTAGRVVVMGREMNSVTARQLPLLRRSIGVVFQDFKLLTRRTIAENVALSLEVQRARPREIAQRVAVVLEAVGLADKRDQFPPELSGGEQQRVAVARALVSEPPILLADEPTGNLDDESAAAVMKLLRRAHARGATVVVATHDYALFKDTYHRVVMLEDGGVSYDSRPVAMDAEGEA